jgi:MYXO-CTERM domain-containing protein
MFRNQSYAFLSAVGVIFGALLLAAPAGAGFNDTQISNDPQGSERGGHTVQENTPPKPPIGGEVPDPPSPPLGFTDWGEEDPFNSDGWSSENPWLDLLPPPPPRRLGDFVGPHLSAGLAQQPGTAAHGAMSPIPAPGGLGLLGLAALASIGRRRR